MRSARRFSSANCSDSLSPNPEIKVNGLVLTSIASSRTSQRNLREHLRFLESVSRMVEPQAGWPIVLSDPNNDPIVCTAIAAGASILCARDRHFYAPNVRDFCRRQDMRILDEIALLAILDRAQ